MLDDKVRNTYRLLDELDRAIWPLLQINPASCRLLTAKQEAMLHKLQLGLHKGRMRLLTEQRPEGFESGMRVKVVKTFEAVRCPIPVPGTVGVVDRVEQNEYGWWVMVAFRHDFKDIAGTTWMPDDSRPIVVWFKPEEIKRIGGRRRVKLEL